MSNIYIGSDNVVILIGLYDVILASHVNNADSVTMSLFRQDKLGISDNALAINEVQNLVIDAPAASGTWTLTYDGQTTSPPMDYNDSVGDVKTALEALSTIEVDDVVVGGNSLDTSPVGNGMSFTWADDLGDVDLMTYDIDSLVGPASATMLEGIKGILLGVATDEGGGTSVGIPIVGHDVIVGDRVRIANSLNYNLEYPVVVVTNDKITITATYVAETFSGVELLYKGVPGGTNIAMSYVATSEGNYRGILPDNMKGIVEREWYYLFVESKKSPTVKLDCVKWQATYSSLTTE